MLSIRYIYNKGSLNLLSTHSLRLTAHRYESGNNKPIVDHGKDDPRSHFFPNTSVGIKERSIKPTDSPAQPLQTPFPPFPNDKNPKTGEIGGPRGPEPTVYGDWQRKGRVTDF